MAGEKRTQEQEDTMLSQTTILIDIEGTTTSISFVKEVLFPYVRDNLKKYITDGWTRDDFKEDYNKLKEQAKKDEDDKVEGFVPITGNNVEEEQESLIKNILWQMDNDRKTTSLKQLQGHMWSEGYKTGILKGRVYDDVPKSLELWFNNGKKIYVYSSGSVESQKLLFGHSEHGDLLKYFSGFFDTEVGAKQECNSYKNILTKLGEKANNVIFLTDVVKEAAAAKEAGILPIIVIREGNVALTDEEAIAYTTVKSFLDVTFQTSNKRQKLNPTELEKKDDSVNPNNSEPMDTSEDVEIPDDNTKDKDNTETKCPQLEQEIKVKTDDTINQTILKDENETMKDVVKDTTVISAKSEEKEQSTVTTKQSETPTKVGATPISDDAMIVATTKSESLSKSETDDKKCTKSETVVQNETTTTNNTVKDNKTREEEGGVSEKSAESETKEEGSSSSTTTSRQKHSSTIEATNSAEEETISKTTKTTTTTTTTPQVSSKVENPTLSSDAIKSDDATTAKINQDEDTKVEKEKKTNDTIKKESKEEQEKSNVVAAAADKCKDGDAKVENQEESKNRETKENVEVKASLLLKSEKPSESVESIEKESSSSSSLSLSSSSKESAKEETVVSDEVMKDKSTVESEKKKLNGTTTTTQNGGDDVPVSDENLHRNGLNEGSSSDKITLTTTTTTTNTTTTTTTTSEEKPAQNGEPPESSSTDTSAESIKVKKVVDSAVADGAGEPDVVPPVVVAATS